MTAPLPIPKKPNPDMTERQPAWWTLMQDADGRLKLNPANLAASALHATVPAAPELVDRLGKIEYSLRALAYQLKYGPGIQGPTSAAMYREVDSLAEDFRLMKHDG